MTLTLQQANEACRLQTLMDDRHQNVFALALHSDTPSIIEFERYAQEHELTEALTFLYDVTRFPVTPIGRALCKM